MQLVCSFYYSYHLNSKYTCRQYGTYFSTGGVLSWLWICFPLRKKNLDLALHFEQWSSSVFYFVSVATILLSSFSLWTPYSSISQHFFSCNDPCVHQSFCLGEHKSIYWPLGYSWLFSLTACSTSTTEFAVVWRMATGIAQLLGKGCMLCPHYLCGVLVPLNFPLSRKFSKKVLKVFATSLSPHFH